MIYLIPLIFAVIVNIESSERVTASLLVLAVTAFSYSLYYSPAFELINGLFGYWVYASLAPAASCALLWCCRGSMPLALTGIFTTIIFINLICLFIDRLVNVEEVYQAMLHGLYVIEILILISRRVAHAIAGFYESIFDWVHLHLIPAHFMSHHPH